MNHKNPSISPVASFERSDILDILRGIALFGICIANYPVLSLYIFQKPEVINAMPTAAIDRLLPYFHFTFIDGKFYSIFSLLFGIGFSIILLRAKEKGKGLRILYRRLVVLCLIGLLHTLLLWEGDILLLYGLLGLLLPLFRNVANKKLIIIAIILIVSPLLFDLVKVLTDGAWNLGNPFMKLAITNALQYGITLDNFVNWQAIHTNYIDIFHYNQSGLLFRWEMLFSSNRLPKVFAMFLVGLYAGRKLIYRNLEENKGLFKNVQRWGFFIGLPTSIIHCLLELDGTSLPQPYALLDTLAYAVSVIPLSLAYTATVCLWYLNAAKRKLLMFFSAPGRMALSNYLLQTIFGVLIFYGIGLGLGARTGLIYVYLIAICVYLFEVSFSAMWLRYFQFGPMEWVWRQLTYGKVFRIKKQNAPSPDSSITSL